METPPFARFGTCFEIVEEIQIRPARRLRRSSRGRVIGASTVVFSVFYNLMFNAFAAKDANRLVIPELQNVEDSTQAEPLNISLSDFDVIRDQNHGFESVVGYAASGMVLLSDNGQTYHFYDGRVTSDAFDFYGDPCF